MTRRRRRKASKSGSFRQFLYEDRKKRPGGEETLLSFPSHLRGLTNNRFGGHCTLRLRALKSGRVENEKSSTCVSFTSEQIARWTQENRERFGLD